MMNAKSNKNVEECPTCRKRLVRVGRNGKFRCSNPNCSVVFVRKDNDRGSKLLRRWSVRRVPSDKQIEIGGSNV